MSKHLRIPPSSKKPPGELAASGPLVEGLHHLEAPEAPHATPRHS